jgi:hypothetical protein
MMIRTLILKKYFLNSWKSNDMVSCSGLFETLYYDNYILILFLYLLILLRSSFR